VSDRHLPPVTHHTWEEVYRWSPLVRHLPVSVVATDLHGTVRVWSPGAQRLFGWSEDEAVGGDIRALTVGPLDQEIAECIMDTVLAGQTWEGEFHTYDRHGAPLTLHVVDAPVIGDSGHVDGIVGISVEVSAARSELTQAIAEITELNALGTAVMERDRERLARELHDDLGQSLTALRSEILWMAERADPDQQDDFQRLERLVTLGLDSVRRICNDLRPRLLDDLGICAALEAMVADFADRHGVDATCFIDSATLGWISDDVETTVFRVVQECLTNIERHAGPVEVVSVELTAVGRELGPGELVVTVRNDGEPYTGGRGFGVRSMIQRAARHGGTVSLTAATAGGTIAQLRIPGRHAFTSTPVAP
jgi:PAS domain S-box-containing protein